MNTNSRTSMVPQDLPKTAAAAAASIKDYKTKKICHFTDKPSPEARC
jgi:hypothetical protein